MITRPILRVQGGKFRLARWLLSFFPAHARYVEPFGGAASVLMLKDRLPAECYNDIDGQIVHVFRVLRDPVQSIELQRRLALTPYSREEFEASYESPTDAVDAAMRTIVRSFMGHGSDSITRRCKAGFRARLADSRNLPAIDWACYPESVPAFVERLAGVVIEHSDAIDVIRRMDSRDTLFYVDPPALTEIDEAAPGPRISSHAARYDLTVEQHIELSEVLRKVQGMVVLSGRPSALYDRELYPDWERNSVQQLGEGGSRRMEAVWLNPACSRALSAGPRPGRSLFADVAA